MKYPDDFVNKIICGDCRDGLDCIPDGSVQACITSPPYWSLRDYELELGIWDSDVDCQHVWVTHRQSPRGGKNKSDNMPNTGANKTMQEMSSLRGEGYTSSFCQRCNAWLGVLGLEPTPEMYIDHLVQIFRKVRRVLRNDGIAWINIGDSYIGSGLCGGSSPVGDRAYRKADRRAHERMDRKIPQGLKPKDMALIPQRLPIALQADGWWVRSVIIWHKPNAMPSSVTDRPTTSHEYVLLLAKSHTYFYDQDAIREGYTEPLNRWGGDTIKKETTKHGKYLEMQNVGASSAMRVGRQIRPNCAGRNKRTIWTIPTKSYPQAHFATFPSALVAPMIFAGTSPQACPHCLAPWERLTKRSGGSIGKSWTNHANDSTQGMSQKKCNEMYDYKNLKVDFVGWQPTCDCKDNDGSGHCIVLDPFAGSGTTCAVALEHSRDYIGIEANADYCKLAETRIAEVEKELERERRQLQLRLW